MQVRQTSESEWNVCQVVVRQHHLLHHKRFFHSILRFFLDLAEREAVAPDTPFFLHTLSLSLAINTQRTHTQYKYMS
jgi:hypothetical protein